MELQNCDAVFKQKFNHSTYQTFFAPGRINLIGEHTDCYGGHVFPCAITFGTYALVQRRSDHLVRVYSMNFPETGVIEFSLKELEYKEEHDWANYPKGVLRYIIEKGYAVPSGLNILFYGDIPTGAGLSSSASIEVVTGVLVAALFKLAIDPIAIALIGKKVENNFIGVNSGIMDQFAIAMGKADQGILLDCQTLAYSYAPLILENHNIIIINTNKRRELVNSQYNERRNQCAQALVELQQQLPIQALGELTDEKFAQYQSAIKSEVLRRRARHVVSENSRTLQALAALEKGDLAKFGKLMNESHISLRDDYEVTGKELDCLAEAAWQQPGVIGARMTGAGFGGCAIAIVEKQATANFIKTVGEIYQKEIGYEGTFYVASIGGGAREIF